MNLQRTDTLFRKVKMKYADKLGFDVGVLMGCHSDWFGDVTYIVSIIRGEAVYRHWVSWSPRAALKKALRDLPKANGGSSTLSLVKSDSATSAQSGRN